MVDNSRGFLGCQYLCFGKKGVKGRRGNKGEKKEICLTTYGKFDLLKKEGNQSIWDNNVVDGKA